MRTVSFPQREPAYLVQAGAESALRAASELPQTNAGAIPAISGKSSWAVVFSANLGGTAKPRLRPKKLLGRGFYFCLNSFQKRSMCFMKNITSAELRAMFLKFYQRSRAMRVIRLGLRHSGERPHGAVHHRGHASRWCPICMGAKHPEGTRLTDVQKCIRTGDIDDVGDRFSPDLLRDAGQLVAGRLFQEGSHLLELGIPDQRRIPGHRSTTAWPSRFLPATTTAPRDDGSPRPVAQHAA